jgi:hypothetical protein
MSSFSENMGSLPQHFILYRDGVGDSMRKDVLKKEIA